MSKASVSASHGLSVPDNAPGGEEDCAIIGCEGSKGGKQPSMEKREPRQISAEKQGSVEEKKKQFRPALKNRAQLKVGQLPSNVGGNWVEGESLPAFLPTQPLTRHQLSLVRIKLEFILKNKVFR